MNAVYGFFKVFLRCWASRSAIMICEVYVCFSMAKHLLSIRTKELLKLREPPWLCESSDQGKVGAASYETLEEIVFGEDHLQEVLQKSFTRRRTSAGSPAIEPQQPPSAPQSPFGGLRAGECQAQLDRNGDVLSLSLSSNAHVIALSRGVLLSFLKLRVSVRHESS